MRYKSYYLFVTRYQRFKYVTLSFTTITANISKIKNWFESDECTELPSGNVLSRGFWMSEPVVYHNFDTIMCLDDDDDMDDDGEIEEEEEELNSEDQLSDEMEASASVVEMTEEQRINAKRARLAANRLRRSMEESGVPILPEDTSSEEDGQVTRHSTSESDISNDPRSDFGVRF